MKESLASRRRAALAKGYRFIWDRTVDTHLKITGFCGFVLTAGGSYLPAGVHDTDEQVMEKMVSIAEDT
jgi:hypothetical protein